MEKDAGLKQPAAAEATTPEPETLPETHQPTWAQAQWASIKSKASGASEYAMVRTRQGIAMFGEPKLGSLVKPKEASAMDESSQSQWASIKSKASGASDYVMLRTRQGISMFGEPKLGSLVKAKGASAMDESSHTQSQ